MLVCMIKYLIWLNWSFFACIWLLTMFYIGDVCIINILSGPILNILSGPIFLHFSFLLLKLKDMKMLIQILLLANYDFWSQKIRCIGNLFIWWSACYFYFIAFRRKTTVKTLCIYADYKSDESYTPSKISVRVGNNFHNLQEIRVCLSNF